MDNIQEFFDDRQKSWCIHCGAWIAEVDSDRDHVPPKALLRKPYPGNLPVVKACLACNSGHSKDEEYLSLFLRCVLVGSTDPGRHTDERVSRALRRHERLRARIERSKTECRVICGESRRIWKLETDRAERVAVKNARGHAFFELGEPMLTAPTNVLIWPLAAMTAAEREEFEHFGMGEAHAVFPEVGSRIMNRVMTGQDLSDGWIIVQEGVYRFGLAYGDSIVVRSVLSEYLATEVRWSN